jgi:hypothetical protein
MKPLAARILSLLVGSVFTAVSALAVTKPPAVGPSIAVPPQALVKTAGQSASFSVTANGTTPLKYQWQFSGTNVTYGNISGATKATYTIAKTTPASAGYYRILVYNSVGPCTSQPVLLTVNSNFAGKYNMVVVNYNPDAVLGHVSFNSGNSSGSALYGTATISGTGPYQLGVSLKSYAGEETGQSNTAANAGNVSTQGVVAITDDQSNLTINMVTGSNGVPIGFLGFGTARPGTGVHSSFILGLNASTAAPTSITSAVGNYTVIIIGYNATAVSKSQPSLNDAAVEIGQETVAANGNFTLHLVQYVTGGGDTLGVPEDPVVGTVSATGVVTIGGVKSTVVTKPIALNGQVIGFQGSFTTTDNGKPFSHILIGLKNTSVVPPL